MVQQQGLFGDPLVTAQMSQRLRLLRDIKAAEANPYAFRSDRLVELANQGRASGLDLGGLREADRARMGETALAAGGGVVDSLLFGLMPNSWYTNHRTSDTGKTSRNITSGVMIAAAIAGLVAGTGGTGAAAIPALAKLLSAGKAVKAGAQAGRVAIKGAAGIKAMANAAKGTATGINALASLNKLNPVGWALGAAGKAAKAGSLTAKTNLLKNTTKEMSEEAIASITKEFGDDAAAQVAQQVTREEAVAQFISNKPPSIAQVKKIYAAASDQGKTDLVSAAIKKLDVGHKASIYKKLIEPSSSAMRKLGSNEAAKFVTTLSDEVAIEVIKKNKFGMLSKGWQSLIPKETLAQYLPDEMITGITKQVFHAEPFIKNLLSNKNVDKEMLARALEALGVTGRQQAMAQGLGGLGGLAKTPGGWIGGGLTLHALNSVNSQVQPSPYDNNMFPMPLQGIPMPPAGLMGMQGMPS